MVDYAELHCHSAFSLLDGASLPERLVDGAVQLGLSALALTDHDDLGGAVRFAFRAREQDDFAAIIGAELTIDGPREPHHLTLLARTAEGYANLSALVTHARSAPTRGGPRVSFDTLASRSAGLLCLSGCPRGELPGALLRGDHLGARRAAGRLHDVFGEHFAVEVMDHGLPEEARLAGDLVALARENALPWVVTNNVHYATVAERILHDVLVCLRAETTLEEAGQNLRPNAEWHLKAPQVMAERWRHDLTGVHTSVALAERCTFRLHQLDVPLPRPTLPSPFTDDDEYLRHLAYTGARTRWGAGVTPVHRAQLDKELQLIGRKGLAGYFLIMHEIVAFAREAGILVQGRGSAANSAVCYCLGITAVDPVRFDLLFERFLSDARDGYPDIDLDIEHTRREEVIQFVYAQYGRVHAAMVCAHTCFRGRGAARDAARVLGFSVEEGGRLAAQVERRGGLDADDIRAAGFDPTHPRVRALSKVIHGLIGLPRHRSTHVGGFVLSTRPIGEVVPVEPAAMVGRTIIQWDKDDLDLVAIPKFDLLGLGMLTALSIGLDLVQDRHGVPATLYGLPDRQEVYDMIARADTIGVFQIESRAQMNSLPRTRPQTVYELAIQVALIRPGPLQGDMVHPYIRRKRGEEPIDCLHPSLAPILRRTLGVPLFQEQGMRLAVEAADFTLDEAESLRRAIGNAHHRRKLAGLLDKLRVGMKRKGIVPQTIERIVRQIEAFSTYGFPESHSTSFALLVYASSWLKCLYPAEFLCAMLNAQPMGFYSAATLIKDAQRHGVDVRGPRLQLSEWDTTMEGDGVRIGLRWVSGLGAAAHAALQQARTDGPFLSADDVVRRVRLPESAWVTLAEAGAFEGFLSGSRRDAVWGVLRLAKSTAGPLPLSMPTEAQISLPNLTPIEETAADLRTTGLTVGPHLVSHVRPRLDAARVWPAAHLRRARRNQWIRVAGLVNTRQRPETAKGVLFLTLEDETGFVNIVVARHLFEQHRALLVRARALVVAGPVSCVQDVWNVKGRRFWPLPLLGSEHAPKGIDFR